MKSSAYPRVLCSLLSPPTCGKSAVLRNFLYTSDKSRGFAFFIESLHNFDKTIADGRQSGPVNCFYEVGHCRYGGRDRQRRKHGRVGPNPPYSLPHTTGR